MEGVLQSKLCPSKDAEVHTPSPCECDLGTESLLMIMLK